MKFIKKKNMQEGEELLYVPQLHWYFVIRHLVRSLPFFIAVIVLWGLLDPESLFAGAGGIRNFVNPLTEYFIPAAAAVVLLFVAGSVFQYFGTEYGITNKRLIIKKGVFRIATVEIPTDRIESIYCRQSLLGRILNYGTIFVSGVGGRMPAFYMLARPYAVRRKIVDVMEKNKRITVVHGDVSMSIAAAKAAAKPKQKVKEEPVYRYGTFVRVLQNDQ